VILLLFAGWLADEYQVGCLGPMLGAMVAMDPRFAIAALWAIVLKSHRTIL